MKQAWKINEMVQKMFAKKGKTTESCTSSHRCIRFPLELNHPPTMSGPFQPSEAHLTTPISRLMYG